MFRRMTLSILGGAVLAFALAVGQTALAACQGYCADKRPGGLEFDSCTLTINAQGQVTDVTCFYTGVEILD